jgi:hypothetical protein
MQRGGVPSRLPTNAPTTSLAWMKATSFFSAASWMGPIRSGESFDLGRPV